LRQKYPVEELDATPAARAPVAGARAAATAEAAGPKGGQDLVVRFKAPVRKEWLRGLKKLGADVKRALGGSAVVVASPNKTVAAALREYEPVAAVDAHVPEIQLSPELLKSL